MKALLERSLGLGDCQNFYLLDPHDPSLRNFRDGTKRSGSMARFARQVALNFQGDVAYITPIPRGNATLVVYKGRFLQLCFTTARSILREGPI